MAFMILKDLNDDTKLKVENRSDKKGILPAPQWIIDGTEELEWCKLEDYVDVVTGEMKKRLIVDEALKAQITQQRFDDELSKQQEKEARKARKDAIKAIKRVDLDSAVELQDFILDLRDYLAEEGIL